MRQHVSVEEEVVTGLNYLHPDLLHNVELLQRQRMLWVVDGSDQMY